jgi:Putative bacterial sensory transduction regulator
MTGLLLQDGLAETRRRMTARGLSAAMMSDDRLVVALDRANTVQFWVTGLPAASALSVQVRSSRRVERAAWPGVVRGLNDWNRNQPLTSAALLMDDWEKDEDGAIVVEASLPVTADHTAAELADFVDVVTENGARFWAVPFAGAEVAP